MQTVQVHPLCTQRRVIGIDPGWRNMALGRVDGAQYVWSETHDLVRMYSKAASLNKLDAASKIQCVRKWFLASLFLFKQVDLVVLEPQMTRSMDKLVYMIIGMLTQEKVPFVLVTPQSVKRTFNTGTGNHANNKAMAVYFTGIKEHNQADAVLEALYANVKNVQPIQ